MIWLFKDGDKIGKGLTVSNWFWLWLGGHW